MNNPNTGTAGNEAWALLLLRIALAIFLAQWGLEKILHPEIAVRISEHFYGGIVSGTTMWQAAGVAELIVALAILTGFQKRWALLIGFLIHLGSTVASWKVFLSPFENHLFTAAIPVLAAFWLMYVMRDRDTKWSLG